jgi:predicted RND superfamily exporter protein
MKFPKRFRIPLGSQWLMLAITGALLLSVAMLVDLKPVVDQNFFFSTNDPGIQQTKKIEQRFPSQPEVILAVSSRDTSSPRYLDRIQKLTQRVHSIGGVSAVKSLAEGPKSFEDALKSPFWSRLLIADDKKSSNVIIFIKGRHTEKPIQRLEQIVQELDARDFRIHLAGPPYVVEMLRRSLAHDFRYFSLTAVVLFGLTMAVLFRSLRLFVGMLCTCTSAVLLTPSSAIDAWRQDRHSHGEPRHHRVRDRVVALGLHDIQLANVGQPCTPHRQGKSESRFGRATHDFSAFFLVDDLRVVRLRELIDCSGEAVA